MPKTKFEDASYTIIMATIMVYGMIVYNVALNTGGVSGQTFLLATHEMIIMVPVAFVLEFFIVGKIAQKLAFTVMKPTDRPQFITYAISICGTDAAMMQKAVDLINIIVTDYEQGQVYTGKVISIKEFGAFVEFAPGKEGMVHISKISKERVNHVEDVLTLGDTVKVVCLGKDKMGRISFSIKDVPKDAK